MAEVNENFRYLIDKHYMVTKYRLFDKTLKILSTNVAHLNAEEILIGQQFAVQFLRHFGHLVTKLDFSAENINDANEEIAKTIARSCSTTLTSIKLRETGHFLLSAANLTFDRVKVLDIRSTSFTDDFRLARIYPRLEELTIDICHPKSSPTLFRPYGHLQRLKVIETNLRKFNASILHGILTKNPQLRRLTVDRFLDAELLAKVNNLPDLHELNLSFDERDFIHLKQMNGISLVKNVRKFTFSIEKLIISRHYQIPVTFTDLETLEITSTKMTQPVQEFIARHDTIKVLGLFTFESLSLRSSVFDIINALPVLEEISLQSWRLITATDILRMFGQRRTLKRIRFVDVEIYRIFRNYFEDFQRAQNGTFSIEASVDDEIVTIVRE